MSLDLNVGAIPVDPGLTMEDQQAYASQDAAAMMHHPMHELGDPVGLEHSLTGHPVSHHLHHHQSPHDPTQHGHHLHPDVDMEMDDVRQRSSASATAAAAVAALSEGENRGIHDPQEFERLVADLKNYGPAQHGVDGME